MSRPVPIPRPYGEIHAFVMDGEERLLSDPEGPPTGRQLLALWHVGALALVLPDPFNQFTKAEAAWAIDWTRNDT